MGYATGLLRNVNYGCLSRSLTAVHSVLTRLEGGLRAVDLNLQDSMFSQDAENFLDFWRDE